MKKRSNSILPNIVFYGTLALFLAIVFEMMLFPTFYNALGCGMTAICWWLFVRVGLDSKLILRHTFAWLMFLSMSLYRILPLFATLVEGKPITYGFQMPVETFVGETFLYLISVGAFWLAVKRRRFNMKSHFLLNKLDFYDPLPDISIWTLGFIGVFSQVYTYFHYVEIGDITGKFLSALIFFQYAPIVLFFPILYKKHCDIVFRNNLYLWIYMVVIVVLSFASNSRQAVMEPFGTFALLLLLTYLWDYRKATATFSKYVLVLVLSMFVLVPFFSDISMAILAVRESRENRSAVEQIQETINVLQNEALMNKLYKQKDVLTRQDNMGHYDAGWSEIYVDNFALNRYCNIRITDATLYYKQRIGDANPKMQQNYWRSIKMLLPMPVLKRLGMNVDKTRLYSQGDYLYYLATGNSSALGSMRVTSHLADGLATFGLAYFPIQFVLFWLCFLVLDSFCVQTPSGIRYSIFGLFCIFSYLAMFRNANGCIGELSYLLRSLPQFLFLSILGIKLSVGVTKLLSVIK